MYRTLQIEHIAYFLTVLVTAGLPVLTGRSRRIRSTRTSVRREIVRRRHQGATWTFRPSLGETVRVMAYVQSEAAPISQVSTVVPGR